jgi:hypothetical protein
MRYAIIEQETGRVAQVAEIQDGMTIVHDASYFVLPPGCEAVPVRDEEIIIGGRYVDGSFLPPPPTAEEKLAAILRDVAAIVPDGEAAAIVASERR